MARKGNGVDLTNDLIRQLIDLTHAQNTKLDGVSTRLDGVIQEVSSVKQELAGVKAELAEHGKRLTNIESSVRQVAQFIGEDRARQDRAVEALARRVEVLERRAA